MDNRFMLIIFSEMLTLMDPLTEIFRFQTDLLFRVKAEKLHWQNLYYHWSQDFIFGMDPKYYIPQRKIALGVLQFQ